MSDTIEVVILADGTMRVTVQGSVSSVNHGSADEMLALAERLMAGSVKRHKAAHSHAHQTQSTNQKAR